MYYKEAGKMWIWSKYSLPSDWINLQCGHAVGREEGEKNEQLELTIYVGQYAVPGETQWRNNASETRSVLTYLQRKEKPSILLPYLSLFPISLLPISLLPISLLPIIIPYTLVYVEHVAKRGGWMPIPRDIQGQAGLGSEHPALAVSVPAHCRGLGPGDL